PEPAPSPAPPPFRSELGAAISHDYQGKDLVVVGVLKGAFVFLADLVRAIELPVAVDFLSVASYGAGTESSGVVRLIEDLSLPIEDRKSTRLNSSHVK